MKTDPAFNEPHSLEEQLTTAVEAHRCEALGVFGLKHHHSMDRCEALSTRMHPTLGKRLCWVHAHAAENFNRCTPLRFAEVHGQLDEVVT
jgi:hypothetical protein